MEIDEVLVLDDIQTGHTETLCDVCRARKTFEPAEARPHRYRICRRCYAAIFPEALARPALLVPPTAHGGPRS